MKQGLAPDIIVDPWWVDSVCCWGDPCDEWPVFMWNGVLCKLAIKEHGVSPSRHPWQVSWRYKVVETSFIPYGVFEERVAVPL